jgi:hypothetical protein
MNPDYSHSIKRWLASSWTWQGEEIMASSFLEIIIIVTEWCEEEEVVWLPI